MRLGEVRQGGVTREEEGGAVDRAGVLVRSAAVDCRLQGDFSAPISGVARRSSAFSNFRQRERKRPRKGGRVLMLCPAVRILDDANAAIDGGTGT